MSLSIRLFQIDAFTSEVFKGNPAAVCPLDQWLRDDLMQQIAAENHLSETAFLVANGEGYDLRWFTPECEVDLCGHATLAAGFVVFQHLDPQATSVIFKTQSGDLTVQQIEDRLVMDFPRRPSQPIEIPPDLTQALGHPPQEVRAARDYLVIYESEAMVRSLQPNMEQLSQFDRWGCIVTAPGETCDFVSRFFAPQVGIPEDPVTGSAHCTLIPYWSERLGQSDLYAIQVSARTGELFCRDHGDRVEIGGRAVQYLEGVIRIG